LLKAEVTWVAFLASVDILHPHAINVHQSH
jgi:hypothetical protein